jgi:uncharacterized protein (TIGR03435 family)
MVASGSLFAADAMRIQVAVISSLIFGPLLGAQTAPYSPSMTFDVASIRQTNPDAAGGFVVGGGFGPTTSSHLSLVNNDLWNLLLLAYPIDGHRVEGLRRLPLDLQRAMFNLEAKADEAADARLAMLPKEQRILEQEHMMQVLLVERFNVKVHWETRDSVVYDLVVAKQGKIQSTGAPPTASEVAGFGNRGVPPIYQQGDSRYGFEYIAHGATMSEIVAMFQSQFSTPIVDKTGLTGKYHFHLKAYQSESGERALDETNPWPPLETAIYDQLGLKFDRSHGPVQFLVVDHAEMPTAN